MPTPLEVADTLEPDLRDAFLTMVRVLEQSVPAAELEALLEARDIPGIINRFGLAVGQAFDAGATTRLAGVYSELVRRPLQTVLGRVASFEMVSQLVLDRIVPASSKLFNTVAQDSVLAVRTILESNYLEGQGVQAAARQIRGVVGLLPQHANTIKTYGDGLEERGLPPDEIDGLVRTYERRLIAYRAENISRTETLAAAESGRYAGWTEQANRGILERHRTWVKWIVTEDDRLCPWCAPMEDQQVRLGEMFQSTTKGFPEGKPENTGPGSKKRRRMLRPDPRSQSRDERGRFTSGIRKRDTRDYLDNRLVDLPSSRWWAGLHPPLHPQCRCDLVLVFTD